MDLHARLDAKIMIRRLKSAVLTQVSSRAILVVEPS